MTKMTLVAAVAICAAALVAAAGSAIAAETLIERGAYLVSTIGACGNCHTPRDKAGRVMPGMALAGGFEFDEAGIGHVVGPNITSDPETGIGKWTEAEIVTALRDGKRPDRDASAIAAYLRSLKPVRHAVARTSYKMPLPPAYGPPVTHVDEPVRADKIAYGGYLAGPVGHCVLCHTPPADGEPFDMTRAFQGGRELPDFGKPGAETVSRNITAGTENTASAIGAMRRSNAR